MSRTEEAIARAAARVPGLMSPVERSVRVTLPVEVAEWVATHLDDALGESLDAWEERDRERMRTARDRINEALETV